MSDLAIYRAPEFKAGQLVDVMIQNQRLTLRITDGTQDLTTGQWRYYVAFKMSYDEDDTSPHAYHDGEFIESFYVGERNTITPAMLRPHVKVLTVDDGSAVDAPMTIDHL